MEIKSVMHDATPSWNGFNYQGKVGVYVCLSMILDKLQDCDKESGEFKQYLSECAIQYEWIEDFSILQNGTYISHHQVKHKADTAFSTHIDALITIRNRNKKILSISDLGKYFTFKKLKKIKSLSKKARKTDLLLRGHINRLIRKECLNPDRSLNVDWKSKIDLDSEYFQCLNEFMQFSSRAFDNSTIYFHTSENVDKPTKNISEYKEIKKHAYLKDDFENKNKLEDLQELNIYIGQNNGKLFDLVLSDSELEKKIIDLVDKILKNYHSPTQYQQFSLENKTIYYNGLLRCIDHHLISRHGAIRSPKDTKIGFEDTRKVITFEKIYLVFTSVFQEINNKYLELLCQRAFNDAYNSKLQEFYNIGYECENTGDIEQSKFYLQKYLNLLSYKERILNQFYIGRYRKLLRELAPHIFQQEIEPLGFYIKLMQEHLLKEVLCEYLSDFSGEIYNDHLVFYSKEGKKYYVSGIDLSADHETQEKYKVTRFQEQMTKLSDVYTPSEYLLSSDYLLVKLRKPESFPYETSRLLNITDVPEKEMASITKGSLLLKSFSEAIEELNDE